MNMRVDSVYSTYKLYNINSTGRHRRADTSSGQIKDSFSLSVHAEDYQLARQAVSKISDVRQEKIDALQTQIAAGQYAISAAMVADKILQNTPY